MTKKRAGAGIEWRNIKVKLGWLQPWGHNPRQSTKKQASRILESFNAFGQVQTVAVGPAFDVYDGHQRLSALLTLHGADYEIDARQSSRALTDDERRRLVIALHAGAQGAWDWDALGGWDETLLASAGMDAELLEQMNRDAIALREMLSASDAANASDADAEPQMDKADELRKKWGVQRGQAWQLGEHRLMCGDSTSAGDVARLMKGEKASLVFTDPPYGVAIGAKNRLLNSVQKAGRNLADIEDDSLSPDDLKTKLLPAFQNIKRFVMSDDCTVFVTAPQGGELSMMMMMMMREAGLPVRHVLIWKKNAPTFSMGRLDYDYQHEPILMTWGKRHKRPMQGKHKTSVWEIDKPRASAEHPTMKPVELVVNALANNSDAGDAAFDAYSGSGTTIIACEQLRRKCRAMEIAPEYVAVALQRWADATGKAPALIDTLDT